MNIRRIAAAAVLLAAVATPLAAGVASAAPSGYRVATATSTISQQAAEQAAFEKLVNSHSFCNQPISHTDSEADGIWTSTVKAWCIG